MRASFLRRGGGKDAFTIRVSPAVYLIEIVMRGFWQLVTVGQFERALRVELAIMATYGVGIGDHRMLVDLTAFDVQTQDVLAGLAAMTRDPTIAARRLALVLSSSLLRLQTRRVVPTCRLFDTRDEALAYLGSDA